MAKFINKFGQEFDVYRCKTDGKIVVHTQSCLDLHVGHQISDKVYLTEPEGEELYSWKLLEE